MSNAETVVHRVVRVVSNPNARGYLVKVLEMVERDEFGIRFKMIYSEARGTARTAHKAALALQEAYGIPTIVGDGKGAKD